MGCLVAIFALFIVFFWLYLFTVSVPLAIVVTIIFFGVVIYFNSKQEEKEHKEAEDKHSAITNAFKEVNFTSTDKFISMDKMSAIAINENDKKVCLVKNLDIKRKSTNEVTYKAKAKVYSYKDILESKIIEDGVTINSTSRTSQIGGALLGGILAGGVGAIIGGLSGKTKTTQEVNRIDLNLVLNDTENPFYTTNFLIGMVKDIDGKPFPIKKDSNSYKMAFNKATRWHSLISVLIRRADEEDKKKDSLNNENKSFSVADELTKLSELLKQGVISQEEFNKQKGNLLS